DVCILRHGVISLAVSAAGWVGFVHPEITPPSNFHHLRDTTAIATGYLSRGASLVMTTPTGSGKTTLAALKIAATLSSGRTVLYLAPTHALVGQVENDLSDRVVGLAKAQSIEDITLDEVQKALPDIAVVTPERCFALLNFSPQLFTNVGLLVFDEFHLLGVNPAENIFHTRVDRRAIDAMLCLLTFQAINKDADYLLLSAMVSNGSEVAQWLASIVGRPVTPFDDKWKPTRQLRSCVLYDREEYTAVRQSLKANPPNKSPAAIPYGLFSLVSGWHPGAADRLLLRPMAIAPIALGRGDNRYGPYLTANRYEVAAHIAAQFAQSGLKVIVFCDSIVSCGSVAKAINARSDPFASERDDNQEILRATTVDEVGAENAIYDAGTKIAAVHHGELLTSERRLVETLFRRRDSRLKILAATSTLAQGLNLPCDVVILASTDRLDETDPEEKTRSQLEPHEILNALGRAGRAGQAATGYSVVIPSSPTWCDAVTKQVSDDTDIAMVFTEGDQCLPISDPLTLLFDIVETEGVTGGDARYLLRRLAISLGDEREGVETFETLTRRTFGFFRRKQADLAKANAWLTQRKASLTKALAESAAEKALPWQDELAARTGATPQFIARLAKAYEGAPHEAVDALTWMSWLLRLLDPDDEEMDSFLRPDSMIRVFGRAVTTQTDDTTARKIALAGTEIAVGSWFEGNTLVEMDNKIASFVAANEQNVKRPTKPDRKAKRARRFALRVAPDLGYLCGVLSQVAQRLAAETGSPMPPMVGFLPQLMRYGFPTPYHFALWRDNGRDSRRAMRAAFDKLEGDLNRIWSDDWNAVRDKLETAQMKAMFSIDFDSAENSFEAFIAAQKDK
ncbi:DEAD/DEAH box helicase, partial [Aquibium sp. ELW1220]|uniref:DEAD/DEAH box helicase n=1 Tax=Aquibium sp. ELW1220 TaxID=2976766 RepID=UPI0025B088CB